jgi:hypothetical protein
MSNGYLFGVCSACCQGCPCYQIDYDWTIIDCDGNQRTYTGSVLFGENGIVCYSDPDVVSVGIGGDGHLSRLSFGDECSGVPGLDVELDFLCDGTVVLDAPPLTDQLQTSQAPCCGAAEGSFFEDFFGEQIIYITYTQVGDEPCDCTGYTPVLP